MKNLYLTILILLSIFTFGCGKKDLTSMSPKEAMKKFYQAKNNGNSEMLRKLYYFPPGTTEEDTNKKIQSLITSRQVKAMRLMMVIKTANLSWTKVAYGKVINDDTAEVGVVFKTVFGKGTPFQQIILKKDAGIWKYHYSKYALTEKQLRHMIKENPEDADLYYLLGSEIWPENSARAKKYFRKYYKLAPNGFWHNGPFMQDIQKQPDYQMDKKKSLKELWSRDVYSSKSSCFRYLANIMMEAGYYQKAELYLKYTAADFDKEYGSVWRDWKEPNIFIERYRNSLARLEKLRSGHNEDDEILNQISSSVNEQTKAKQLDNKNDMSEIIRIREKIKKNPQDGKLYYQLGQVIQREDPVRASRYFMTSYYLAPKGEWVDADFKNSFKPFSAYQKETEHCFEWLQKSYSPEQEGVNYIVLTWINIETGNFSQAEKYLSEFMKRDSSNRAKQRAKYAKEYIEKVRNNQDSKILNLCPLQ